MLEVKKKIERIEEMIGIESKAERSLVWKGKVINSHDDRPVEKRAKMDPIKKKDKEKVEDTEYEYYSEDDAQEISKREHGKLVPVKKKDEPLEDLKVLSPLF